MPKGRFTNWDKYPEAQKVIAEVYQGRLAEEITRIVNERCGTSFSTQQIRSYLGNRKMRSFGTKGHKGCIYVWTPELDAYLLEHKDEPSYKVAEDMNRLFSRDKYGTVFSYHSVEHRKWRLRYLSSNDGRFRKGDKPTTTHPKGTEKRWDHYVWVKMDDGNTWKQKHRIVWEEAYGPIPEGKLVGFRNGDTTDCSLDNLMLIDQSENVIMARWGVRRLDPEVRPVGEAAARLRAAAYKRSKK